MKKFLAISICLALVFSVFATSFVASAESETIYYVSENGDDSNSGTSQDAPLKTIEAVNALTLASGTQVLFERGSIWRGETLVCQDGVYYGAYGTGAQPAFYGSDKNYAREEYWELTQTPNIYKSSFTLDKGIGAIVMDNGQFVALRYTATERVTDMYGSGMFIYNTADNHIYLRVSQGNPGAVFSDMEFIAPIDLINGNGADDIAIENITLKYGNYGYRSVESQNGVTLRNLNISYIGGNIDGDGNRGGNGIEFYGKDIENILVDGCVVTQCYDTALTCQMNDGSIENVTDNNRTTTFKDITVQNCDFSYCYWTIELWNVPKKDPGNNQSLTSCTISNVDFINNKFSYAGYGFGGGANYPNYNNQGLRFYNDETHSSTFVNNFQFADNYNPAPDVCFTNNTFCDARDYLFYSGYGMNFSGNTFVLGDTTKVGKLGSASTDKELATQEKIRAIDSTATFKSAGKISTSASQFAYNVMSNGGFENSYYKEYIVNGNFSDGKTGWLDYGAKTSIQNDSATGNKMLRLGIQADFAYQLINLPIGSYNLTFDALAFSTKDNAEEVTSYVSLHSIAGNAYVFRDTAYTLKTTDFSKITIPFEITTAGNCTLRIGPTGLNCARYGDMFGKVIDNVSVTPVSDTTTGVDLSEEDGWYCANNLIYSSDKVKGNRSLDTSSADVDGAVSVKGNTPYKISWWYKGDCDVTLKNGNAEIASKQASSNDWTYYEHYFTTPAGCERLNIDLSGNCLYDEFILSPYPGYSIYTFNNGMIATSDKRYIDDESIELFVYSDVGYKLSNTGICRDSDGNVLIASQSANANGYNVTASSNAISLDATFVKSSEILKVDYIKDGDFETITSSDLVQTGTAGKWWKGNNGTPYNTVIVDTNNNENHFLKLGADFTQQIVTVPAGGHYKLSFSARTAPTGTVAERVTDNGIYLNVFSSVGSPAVTTYYSGLQNKTFTITHDGFIYYSYDVEIPSAGDYYIRIGRRSYTNNRFVCLDNVKLEREIEYSATLSSPYLMSNNLVYAVAEGTTAQTLINAFELTNATISISNEGALATGYTITLMVENKAVWTKTISVVGDVNSDSVVNLLDLVRMKKHLAGAATLTVAQEKSANMGTYSADNLIAMIQYLLSK